MSARWDAYLLGGMHVCYVGSMSARWDACLLGGMHVC